MRNPRSAYVRRKQARKPCLHCGSTDVIPYISELPVSFSCRSCKERYFALGGWPKDVGGTYGAYTV
jgi:hypothetical protein